MISFSRGLRRGAAGRSAFALAVCGALVAAPTPAEVCAANSGPRTAVLVELYTSEGCSSCPPADRWLTSTFPPGTRDPRAIPLAFHVDYWDRLGWKDRFAAPAWTERQNAAARANGLRFVYTPQVLVQGRDFPDWGGKDGAAIAAAAGTQAPRANLSVEALGRRGAVTVKATARVPASIDRKGASLYVALADSGLESEVKAGENAGARLRHDYVVRALRGGIAVDASGEASGEFTLPLPRESGAAANIVAFVQNTEDGDVLQALSLPLAACSTPR